jgi:hypothetical protein
MVHRHLLVDNLDLLDNLVMHRHLLVQCLAPMHRHHLIFHLPISLILDRHKAELDLLDLDLDLGLMHHHLQTFQTFSLVHLRQDLLEMPICLLNHLENLDLSDNLDLAANLDLTYHLHQDHLLQIVDHEDFSLTHLLLLQLDLAANLDLVDNLDLAANLDLLDNLGNPKVLYHQLQVANLQVDSFHYL